MESLEETGLNLVFDRTFFTEQVYCMLGYKEYTFDDEYTRLVKKLSELDYNIYFVVLYLKDVSLYEKRLRRIHHNYQKFSLDSSVKQQETYLKLAGNIKNKKIKIITVAMDDYEKAYNKVIKTIPVLKENNVVYKDK